jgi:hypothetical protein
MHEVRSEKKDRLVLLLFRLHSFPVIICFVTFFAWSWIDNVLKYHGYEMTHVLK